MENKLSAPSQNRYRCEGPQITVWFAKLKSVIFHCLLCRRCFSRAWSMAYGAVITVWEPGSSVSNHQLTQATAGNNMMASSIASSVPAAGGCDRCSGRHHWLALLSLTKVKVSRKCKRKKKLQSPVKHLTFVWKKKKNHTKQNTPLQPFCFVQGALYYMVAHVCSLMKM